MYIEFGISPDELFEVVAEYAIREQGLNSGYTVEDVRWDEAEQIFKGFFIYGEPSSEIYEEGAAA